MTSKKFQKQNRSLLWAASFSLILFGGKAVAFAVSGSTLVLGSCLDSLVDSVMSFVNFKVQKLALSRPDKDHPFGHGGFEVLASFLQGILLFAIGCFLIYQSIFNYINTEFLNLSFDAMIISSLVLGFAALSGASVYFYLKIVNKGVESLSVKADKGHYLGDFWQNSVSVIGILTIWFSKLAWLDSVFGIIVGGVFIYIALPIVSACVHDISSHRINEHLKSDAEKIAKSVDSQVAGIHRFRTRTLGPNTFMDFHMKLPDAMPLKEAHEIGERVAKKIRKNLKQADVNIHLDPASEPDDDLW